MATYAFSEICEAYEVLSTPELKEVYDKFGEQLMKQGIPDAKFAFKGGYKFLGNSFEIFEKFFGTSNPFTIDLDEHGRQIGSLTSKEGTSMMDAFYKRFSNLTLTVKCTIEEFYYGCQKKIHFERLNLTEGGKQEMIVDTKLIHIKPGMGVHSELIFEGEGHMRAGQPRSDLVVTFKEKSHPEFKRFGNDLIYEHKV